MLQLIKHEMGDRPSFLWLFEPSFITLLEIHHFESEMFANFMSFNMNPQFLMSFYCTLNFKNFLLFQYRFSCLI